MDQRESKSNPTENGRGRVALGGVFDRGAAQEGAPATWEAREVPGEEPAGGPETNLRRKARSGTPAPTVKKKRPDPGRSQGEGGPEPWPRTTRESEDPIRAKITGNRRTQPGGTRRSKGGPEEREPQRGNSAAPSRAGKLSPELLRVAERARREPEAKFHSLAHLIDEGALRRSYERIRADAATGVDGVSKAQYGQQLDERLKDLHERLRTHRWRHQPLRKVEIPKEDGTKRPLGLSTVEDKIVQGAMREVLETVYEPEFLECSYGFRPQRRAHDAIRAIDRAVWQGWGNVLIEADIVGFFNSVDRTALLEMMREKVPDGAMLRLVSKCLRAGVMEGTQYRETEEGTAQGSSLSPLLANIYLHYVLDRWFEEQVKPRLSGRAGVVRYCDDFVLLFEKERDAERVMEVLPKRMGKYNLTLHPEKTRVLKFERPKAEQRQGKGPATVDFLGFTLYWGRTQKKTWRMRAKTRRKSLRRSLQKTEEWCRRSRHRPVQEQHEGLIKRILGHYNYFGINGNLESLERYYKRVIQQWRKWLNRRSQNARMSWRRFYGLLRSYPIPMPRICVPIWG